MKRKREIERRERREGNEGGERRRCEGRLGHLPTARSVTETAVGDALDAAPQSLLPPRFAAPPLCFLSAALVSDAIRTLRILNSKLQNMLSGRYKSKVGSPEG